MGTLRSVIERIRKPLDYAVRDDYAHVKSLSKLEQFIRSQSDELEQASRDPERVRVIMQAASGIDQLPEEGKKERIIRLRALLEELERPSGPLAGAADGPGPGSAPSPSAQAIRPETSIQYCRGVGPKRAELLRKMGIVTAEDALAYLPWRYEDRSNLKKIGRVLFGTYETVAGEVVSAEVVRTKRLRKKVFELTITDRSGILVGSWFNQEFMKRSFSVGQRVILSGVVKANPFKGGVAQMDSPEYEVMDDDDPESQLIHSGRIVPVYRATAGLSVRMIRTLMKNIVDSCGATLPDLLPEELIRKHGLLPAAEAVVRVHFPPQGQELGELNRGTSPAHRRLSYEELFLLELGLARRKQGMAAAKKGISFRQPVRLEAALRKALPYTLTRAQERVILEIKRDMAAERPMNRLVQGDVGCGKTVVAFIAALMAVESGYQACIMAPTEILAEQHARNMGSLAAPVGASVRLLTGSLRRKEKDAVLAEIASGSAQIVVGTHALIEGGVLFRKLGLAVIDEQHRFGVLQRSSLTAKGYDPDVLVMTATPIPRTLALTVYGDLDVSVIDELPPGRSPVATRLVFEQARRQAYALIEKELSQGRQAYVVYPLVEETEKSDLKAATEMAAHLQRDIFPGRRVGLLHGRMKGEEKESAMQAFQKGETQILVSTTVIEVGVDVPNATVMVIEHPERFGLAQLHQLRGRVGRGVHPSLCILMGPRMFTDDARERLLSFTRTNDGFRIAEEDLRLRGPGEFFGTRQSGLPDLRAANLLRDADLLEQAREDAFDLLANDPSLERHAGLLQLLRRKWEGRLGLINVS